MFVSAVGILMLLVSAAAPIPEGVDDLLAEKAQNPSARKSFDAPIKTLLDSKCIRCHDAKTHKGGLDLGSPQGLARGGESGPVVVGDKPDESPLFERIAAGEMPPDKKERLSDAEIEQFRRWIAEGASLSVEGKETAPALSQHDVIPIMLRHCTYCHGRRQQKADLDLTSRAAMLKGGKSGPALILGRPDESLLIQRIRKGQMPPPAMLVEACVKPVDASEIETLVRWISAMAPEVAVAPDVATTTPDPLVTDNDRDYWAFKAPQRPTVPRLADQRWVRNPVDAFVLQKLREKRLVPSPEADSLTLLRRASFDLTGLPPEPGDIAAFLADDRPDAYEHAIDRMLASPRYGERWGKYWLDLAGYADSEGKREQDLPRPNAWRYRDYVIQSINNDKPYDRFLIEQLAGDELFDYEHAQEISGQLADNLIATGFLRMAPDATWANITGYPTDRVEVIADEIDILGSVVMGLTLKCARCHSHKFDPIPHRDYYRLLDIFKGAYDEYDWLKPDVRQGLGPISVDVQGGRLLPRVTTLERKSWEASEARITQEIKTLREGRAVMEQTITAKYVDQRINAFPEPLRSEIRKMLATPSTARTPALSAVAEKYEKDCRIDREGLKRLDAAFKRECDAIDAKINTLESQRREAPAIQALWDRGAPSPTYIYRRGDLNMPGRLVGPGVPSVLTDGKTPFEVNPPFPAAKSTGRRLAFAKWVTRPDHPLTARVAVNRVWKHHFGTGIVKTLGNFGKAGTPPTHPELLDWLAVAFVENGWRLKPIHKLLMTSATYRQSSRLTEEQEAMDRENAFYSRMPLTRLDAESLYDAMLFVSGRLFEKRGGPADPVVTRPDGLVTPSGGSDGRRRMIYVTQARKKLPTHLEVFDYPQMNPNCLERRDSIVATQALQLFNTTMVQELAADFARRVIREAGNDPKRRIERVYRLAFSREPSDEERAIGLDTIRNLAESWSKAPNQTPTSNPDEQAMATYCHAIMNTAAFLYVD